MVMTSVPRRSLFILLFAASSIALAGSSEVDDSGAKMVVPAAEARNHVGETRTVEATVRASKNAGPREEYYLDSEEDFHDEKNFAVVISYAHVELFKQAGVDDPSEYYRGKTLRVTGKLIEENDQVRIRVEDPKQIQVVESDSK